MPGMCCAGSKNLYQAVVQQAAEPRLYEGSSLLLFIESFWCQVLLHTFCAQPALQRYDSFDTDSQASFSSICMLSYALLSSFECAAVFDLQKKFANEYNMLCLHVWMLLVRLRSEGKDGKDIAQMVYETFQDNVEARVRGEGVKVSFCLFQCKWHWKPC